VLIFPFAQPDGNLLPSCRPFLLRPASSLLLLLSRLMKSESVVALPATLCLRDAATSLRRPLTRSEQRPSPGDTPQKHMG
jgi:hypothetical protein